jgi:hypothetical protein
MVLRSIPSSRPIELAVKELTAGRSPVFSEVDDNLLNPALLVSRVEEASSRARGIAELNEFVSDVSRQLEKGVRVPAALARVCFACGTLLALLALVQQLTASALMVTPALLALVAGLASGLGCLQIGRAANQRRRTLREAAETLRRKLQKKLPTEAAEMP